MLNIANLETSIRRMRISYYKQRGSLKEEVPALRKVADLLHEMIVDSGRVYTCKKTERLAAALIAAKEQFDKEVSEEEKA